MIINIPIPKHWGHKTKEEYVRAIKNMARELRMSIDNDKERFKSDK